MARPAWTFVALAGLLLGGPLTAAGEVRVAVASNFAAALAELAVEFESAAGHRVLASPASTGKLHAQISNGAPFEVFLAADAVRPRLLEESGLAVAGTRFTYAFGRLALWTASSGLEVEDGAILKSDAYRHLAIANPRTAPYGAAARQVLERMELWQDMQRRLVFGENVGQTFQFVSTGNAEVGFVALSQLLRPGYPATGSHWIVPPALYRPIDQQAILLGVGRDNPAAVEFVSYLRSAAAREIIERFGYGVE